MSFVNGQIFIQVTRPEAVIIQQLAEGSILINQRQDASTDEAVRMMDRTRLGGALIKFWVATVQPGEMV